ncbi:hypothetical protein F5Y19DRAFT_473075 [Xylariaceae sp. FL1651]|nr:hypothetical protein F5Y19DRAFT_473075 [Xylariaceae sp. FL1651]
MSTRKLYVYDDRFNLVDIQSQPKQKVSGGKSLRLFPGYLWTVNCQPFEVPVPKHMDPTKVLAGPADISELMLKIWKTFSPSTRSQAASLWVGLKAQSPQSSTSSTTTSARLGIRPIHQHRSYLATSAQNPYLFASSYTPQLSTIWRVYEVKVRRVTRLLPAHPRHHSQHRRVATAETTTLDKRSSGTQWLFTGIFLMNINFRLSLFTFFQLLPSLSTFTFNFRCQPTFPLSLQLS